MNSPKLKVVHYCKSVLRPGRPGRKGRHEICRQTRAGRAGPRPSENIGRERPGRRDVVCGDNYFAEHLEEAATEAVKLIASHKPDLFFAGPAFEAGRYGMSCGAICKAVEEKLNIPAVTWDV